MQIHDHQSRLVAPLPPKAPPSLAGLFRAQVEWGVMIDIVIAFVVAVSLLVESMFLSR
jgi:hypothetical protein